MKHILIFTDGACRGNPGPGGWGVLIRYGNNEKTMHGSQDHTTNNRMELTAAIEALAAMKEACRIDLYTDSVYVQKGISEWLPNWKKRQWKKSDNKPVINKDLWIRLELEASRHQIQWHWVKGHSGHAENDIADALANQAIDQHLALSIKEEEKIKCAK